MHGTQSISAGGPKLQRGRGRGRRGTCRCFQDLIQHPGEIKKRSLSTPVGNRSCFAMLRWVPLREPGWGFLEPIKKWMDRKSSFFRNRLIDQKSLFSTLLFSRQNTFFSKSSSFHCLVPDAFQ